MSKLPYFKFYPADWISSPRIICSTLAQQGAYIRLLCLCWLSGDCSLPDDDSKLSALSGLPESDFAFIRQMFQPHRTKRGFLTNKRLSDEWKVANGVSVVRSQAGRKSGESRRTHVQHMPEQNTNKSDIYQKSEVIVQKSEVRSHSSEVIDQSQKKKIKTSVRVGDPFEQFWLAYPRKVGKNAARKVWAKLTDRPPVIYLTEAIARAKQTEQWKKENGQFIPHPATWLNRGQWADEPVESIGVSDPNGFLAGLNSFITRGS